MDREAFRTLCIPAVFFQDAWRQCFKENDNEFFTTAADRARLKAALDRLESITMEQYTEELKNPRKEFQQNTADGNREKTTADGQDVGNADTETSKKRKLDSSSSSRSSSDSLTKVQENADAKENADDGSKAGAVRTVLNTSQRNAIEEFASKRIMLIQGVFSEVLID